MTTASHSMSCRVVLTLLKPFAGQLELSLRPPPPCDCERDSARCTQHQDHTPGPSGSFSLHFVVDRDVVLTAYCQQPCLSTQPTTPPSLATSKRHSMNVSTSPLQLAVSSKTSASRVKSTTLVSVRWSAVSSLQRSMLRSGRNKSSILLVVICCLDFL